MKKTFILVVLIVIAVYYIKDEDMPDASQFDFAYSRLEFECVFERDHLPELDEAANVLYRYGLYLEHDKGRKNYEDIAKYYRVAAAHGHYKAATNLQFLLSAGQSSSPDASKETIDLVEVFIKKEIPGAYYDMAHYLEAGYGVKQDLVASKAYFRRAADMGSPDAQYYVARLLSYVPNAGGVVLSMYKCAMEQGHRSAAGRYSSYLQDSGLYEEALQGYQTAIRNGDVTSASVLADAFNGPSASDALDYLALTKDSERVVRYKKIQLFLGRHEHLGAKIPELDDIVPLPPAPLPEWDGTFRWQRERDPYVPVIPPQELIEKLSAEKGLDPATGLPLSPRNT
ncbi:SEL1-like repeat protein [Pseudomonas violetae]|uniref:Sel1 repeat family protein n=1 Tax=Pseudomonas violetae TaxID=2915813 RepID=A0ABT0F7F8_9PSED|nr:DUF6396 domain-containing protein [Pseudomonas violetae]MCK1793938.1 sel1 repeat family protein [Pseudomonas violetae]